MRLPSFNIRKHEFNIDNFKGGLNTRDTDHTIADNELSGGQNIGISPNGAIIKRLGTTRYGNIIGTTTGILGLFEFVNSASVQVNLAVYDTDVYYYNVGTWTSLSQTLTTNLPADGAYNPFTDKFYITNGTDNVVVVTSTTSVTTDANFKKGKYVVYFQDRMITANLSGNADVVWYSDAGVDTFTSTNWFTVEEAITGLEVLYDKLLIFTKKKIYRVQNFIFDGVANSQPASRIALPTEFGAIIDRTIVKVNNLVYFLALDHENKLKVMVTDGWTTKDVSSKISATIAGMATNQTSACAGYFGSKYYIALKSSSGTTNDRILIYDTKFNRWLPVYTGWTPSCFMMAETSNRPTLYWGDTTIGAVYTSEIGTYDELPKTSYYTGQDADKTITASTTTRVAQSFKITTTEKVTSVAMLLKKSSGTTTELTIRIETDSSGVPSGTLANANATTTLTAFTNTAYAWKTATFATAFNLTLNTVYWLVVKHTTEGSGTSVYAWGADGSSPTYTSGNLATYSSSAWTADTNTDAYFIVYTQQAIDGYFDTKSFDLGVPVQNKQLYKGFLLTDSPGNWNLEFGWITNEYTSYNTYLFNMMSTTGNTWAGELSLWGSGLIWGGTQNRKKHEIRYPMSSTKGQQFKFRFRNRNINETFTIYKMTLYYLISKILR